MQHRVIRMPDNTYNLSVLSRTLHAKVRIIIAYAIKITLKYLSLRHINTKNPDSFAGVGIYCLSERACALPYSLKKDYLTSTFLTLPSAVRTMFRPFWSLAICTPSTVKSCASPLATSALIVLMPSVTGSTTSRVAS